MPDFLLTSPEGKKFKVTGPEGSTPEQALAKFKQLKPELFKPKEAKPEPARGVLGTIKEAIFPSEVPPDPAAEKENAPSRMVTDIPREMRYQQARATEDIRHGFANIGKGGLLYPALGAAQVFGGGLGYLTSPLSGIARSTVFSPISRATGHPEIAEYGGLGVDLLANWPGAISKGAALLGVKGAGKVAGLGDVGAQAAARATAKSLDTGILGAIENVFSPASRSKEAMKAAEIGKQILSEAANATAQSARVFGDYEKIVAKFTPEEGTNFIRSMLSGEKVTPELEPLQKALRQEIDKRQNELHNLGILKYFDAHYFPLQWKNPAEASRLAEAGNVFSTGRGAGLGGSPGSLRARTLSGIDEGLARGLELASTNPINLAANMITEMDRFLVARRLMGEFERAGIVKNVRAGEEAPKLWQPIRDKLFSEGNYYAPPSVLRIFNNITEPSFFGRGVGFQAIRGFQNALNHAQLSWPGFHGITISREILTTQLARAVSSAMEGEFGKAAKLAGSAIIDPTGIGQGIHKAWLGSKLRKGMLDPSKVANPELRKIVEAAIAGGARTGMDRSIKVTSQGSFWKSMKEGWFTQDVKNTWKEAGLWAPFKVLGRTLETVSAPLMEQFIPRAKLGVFHGMASDWLKRNPMAAPEELRTAMQRIWNSVDNRMGEMVYDNLMWSKTQKDVAFMLMRSAGWNIGTIRELGGAAVDAARAGGDVIKSGKLGNFQKAFTERMAYGTAMPIMTMYQGAILTYLMTGKGPTTMIDYFFPPTGNTLRNGVKERMSLPGYDKDVMEWMMHPASTLVGKAHPTIAIPFELYQNRDWSGATIYSPPDIQRMKRVPESEIAWNVFADMMHYTSEKFMPIGKIGDLAREAITATTGTRFQRRRQPVVGEEGGLVQALKLLGMSPAPIKLTDPEVAQRLQTQFSDIPAENKRLRGLQQ